MYYEHFLYTRTAASDYTTFVRPEHTSKSEVKLLTKLIDYVPDVTWLTRWHPALYCFPLGDAIYLLRHYHGGEHHNGNPISILEGIAAPRGSTRDFASHLHRIVALQHDYLNVIGTVAHLDEHNTRISRQHSLRITRVQPPTPAPLDAQTIEIMAQHEPDVSLYLPFTEKGSQLLVSVLSSPSIPPLVRFAHGTTSDGVRYLNEIGITLDVIGYFGLSRPSLRQRSNDRLIMALDGYARRAFIPPEPIANPEDMETVPSTSGPRYRLTPSGERVPITTPTVPAENPQRPAVDTRPEDNLTVAQPTADDDNADGWINSLAKRIFRRDE